MLIEKHIVQEIESRYNNGEGLAVLLKEKKVTHYDYGMSRDYYNPQIQNRVEKNIRMVKRMEDRIFHLMELMNLPETHPDAKKRLSNKIDNLTTFYSKANPLDLKDIMCPNELLR